MLVFEMRVDNYKYDTALYDRRIGRVEYAKRSFEQLEQDLIDEQEKMAKEAKEAEEAEGGRQ